MMTRRTTASRFAITDGSALKSLGPEELFGPGWNVLSSTGAGSVSDNHLLYEKVAFIRRAVRLRSHAVASVPVTIHRGARDYTKREEWAGLMGQINSLLRRTEGSLCLYGAGYWLKRTNGMGLNPTPEWLTPTSIYPFFTPRNGLEYFRRVIPMGTPGAGTIEHVEPERMVAFWYDSFNFEHGPGVAAMTTAAAAGSAIYNSDAFVSQYFSRGAIKATLLQVEGNPQPSEMMKLEAWWKRMAAGVKNAWNTIAIKATVTPVVIGDGMKDINSEPLIRQYRQDVAAAFDIPETLLMQGAANYATASVDMISFYSNTIFPECEFLAETINRQWLLPAYGIELQFHPEQTDAMQDQQLQQAQTLSTLVGQPIMTVDEARSWLGMGPMPKVEQPQDPQLGDTTNAPVGAAERVAGEPVVTKDDATVTQEAEMVSAG